MTQTTLEPRVIAPLLNTHSLNSINMSLIFKANWNVAKPAYVEKYGDYQAFLASFNERDLRHAFLEAEAATDFSDPTIKQLIATANSTAAGQSLTIEQGSHQPEDTVGGGFCLHFTGRLAGKAYHFYVVQHPKTGKPLIFEISYMDKKQVVSDYAVA